MRSPISASAGALSSPRRLACCIAAILLLANRVVLAQAPDHDFQRFFSTFTDAIRRNDPVRIAEFIHFPFFVYGSRHSRSEFLNDKNETVNVFISSVRNQIVKASTDDFVLYRNKLDVGLNKSDCALIPSQSPVVEFDVINEHGGPARRLMFAKSGSSYRLYCIVQ